MPVMTQQTQLHAVPQQSSTQTDSFLTRLPRELRDMIYDQVVAGNHEIVIPHPLTQTSKQLREEFLPVAARDVGSRAILNIFCEPRSRDFQLDTAVDMDDLNSPWLHNTRLYTDKTPPAYPPRWLSWRDFSCGEFGKQMIPQVRHLRIWMSMADSQKLVMTFKIVVIFSRDSAPKTSVSSCSYQGRRMRRRELALEAYRRCLSVAEKFQEQKAVCSAEWVDAFLTDIVHGWRILLLQQLYLQEISNGTYRLVAHTE